MPAENEKKFQLSNKCYICQKLCNAVNNKVRDHCPVTRKYRDSAHSCCNVNLKLTQKVSIIFHNLKGHDNHLIIEKSNIF